MEHLWVVEGYVWATTNCSCADLKRGVDAFYLELEGEVDPFPQIFWSVNEGAGDLPHPCCLNILMNHTRVTPRHKLTNKISLQHFSFGRIIAIVREMGWWIASSLPRGSTPAQTDVSHLHIPCWRKGFSSPHVGISPTGRSTGDCSFGMHVLIKKQAVQTVWSVMSLLLLA